MIGTRVGPYRIERKLGQGGMGAVYEAVHETIERRVAIKVLNPQLAQNSDVSVRFINEARAVNLVNHPGLVQVSDFGQMPDGTAYIVMELLEGETLSKRLARLGGKLPLPEMLKLVRQISSALQAAHMKGIVHRDLKPDNVSPVEKVAKTSRLPREQRAEVGSPPKPLEAQSCASVGNPTNCRPRIIRFNGRASCTCGPNSGDCDLGKARP